MVRRGALAKARPLGRPRSRRSAATVEARSTFSRCGRRQNVVAAVQLETDKEWTGGRGDSGCGPIAGKKWITYRADVYFLGYGILVLISLVP
mmetsp:Transcript_10693/g.23511  ORF Transcript_10693/g.23511 Transcript_10693/m.23511 type:complete len:92 (-) Transcript_10693:45-320(-)